tara:strand:- start:28 stop:537 length:510 start_codon:yes stop_codon:yes gene_type:complete
MATNLQFIKSASGTSVSSLSVTDCFSATYDVYKITISKLNSSAVAYGFLRFIDSGGVDSTSNYDSAGLDLVSYTGFFESKLVNSDKGYIGYTAGTGTADMGGFVIYVFNPDNSSSYTFYTAQSSIKASGGGFGGKYIGVHKVAEQISGINFLPASGTWDNITINVYGVK